MNKRITTIIGSAAVGVLALAACGDGDAENGGGDDGELTEVTVGVLPIAPSVGIYYGIEEGIFEEHGLDVELSETDGGAAMLPAVQNQQMEFGVGNPMSVMNALDQGLDMRILTGYSNSLPEGEDVAGVVASPESGIEDWADLEGQTVAINALQTQGDLTIMEAVEDAGGDPDAVDFTELPFPDMPAQLEQGNTDAIWVPEPFLSNSLAEEENQLVGSSFQDTIPGMPTMTTFSSESYLEDEPEVAESFQEAMTESLAAAEEDEETTREMLTEFIDMDEETAQNIMMEEFSGDIRSDEIAEIGEMMDKFDFIDEEPAPEQLYHEDE